MKFFTLMGTCLAVAAFSTLVSAQDETKKAEKPAAKAGKPSAKEVEADSALKDVRAKASYAIGLSIGRRLKQQVADIDADLVAKGCADALTDSKPLIGDEDAQAAIEIFQREVNAKQVETNKAATEKNKKEGEAFLAANQKKAGVQTTKSGLQYKVLKQGTGKVPASTDQVTTHYQGTLIDGTVFDSSYKRGEPATFPVDGVIAGWTEALQLMKVGSKWQLFIPPNLAYGERGSPPAIGPQATLIFDIELLGIDKGE